MMNFRKNQSSEKKAGGILLQFLILFLILQAGVLFACRCSPSAGIRTKSAFSSFCRDLHTPARPARPGEQIEVQVRLLAAFAGFRRGQNDRFSGESALLPEAFSLFDCSDRNSPLLNSSLMSSSGIFTNHPARAAPVFSCRI